MIFLSPGTLVQLIIFKLSAIRRHLIVKINFGFSTLRGTPFDDSQLRAQMSYSNSENGFV